MEILTLILIILVLIGFVILLYIYLPHKPGLPKYENSPPPPKRKSFKERLAEKQNEEHPAVAGNKDITMNINYVRLPTDKVDTPNPPKETGT